MYNVHILYIGGMTNPEIIQCVFDIKSWFIRSNDSSSNLEDRLMKATLIDYQKLEKTLDIELPKTLKILLNEMNGGIYFMDMKLMSTNEIINFYIKLEKNKEWKNNLYIPFAFNDDIILIIKKSHHDDDNDDGEVYEWELDNDGDGSNGCLGSLVCHSLSKYLEDYRNNLLSGHYEYLDDVGVIEVGGGSGSSNNGGNKSKKQMRIMMMIQMMIVSGQFCSSDYNDDDESGDDDDDDNDIKIILRMTMMMKDIDYDDNDTI